jgi:glycosyltransferase involved in cell wall biosynthesis
MRRELPQAIMGKPEVIINFRYDCYALRDVYPDVPIITVINDDFVNRARPYAKREAVYCFESTLRVSDVVLVVSYPLLRQAREIVPDARLFLPWARTHYATPEAGLTRRDVLYWGFINDRIDWDVVLQLLDDGQRVHFVGPIERSARAEQVLAHRNVEYHGVRPLAELSSVVDRCCCSILPYNVGRSKLEVTINNRAFELLAFGLPLVYADYPELLEAPEEVISKATTTAQYKEAIAACVATFDARQARIRDFLSEHDSESRYRQLLAEMNLSVRARRDR